MIGRKLFKTGKLNRLILATLHALAHKAEIDSLPYLVGDNIMADTFGACKVVEDLLDYGKHQQVLLACLEAYKLAANRAECNFFVHAVAKKLGISMAKSSTANQIYNEIQKDPWIKIGEGLNAGEKASSFAVQGFFVLGAWQNLSSNGHVLVITGPEYILRGNGKPNSRVNAAQGKHNAPQKAFFNHTIRDAFQSEDLKKVYYAYRAL